MVRGVLIALLLLASLPAFAKFTASVDRRVIDENDVVLLELQRDAQVFVGNPDLTALEQDFNVLGTQRASQFTIAGGRTESITTWTVTLQPKRRGALRIPAVEYDGERTEPIIITVTQPSPEEAAALGRTVFFETEVSKPAIWVQEQLLYVVRLYYAADAVLFGDLPPPPTIADTVVQPLGDSRPGVEVRGGVRYNVIEQRYALVPQRSGELAVPPETFTGAVRLAERGTTRRKNIRITSDGHRVQVRAQPPSWPDGVPWLPARGLELNQRWEPTPPGFRAGEPVTRTLELVARGIAASTLPEISVGEPDNARSYRNQPALDEGLAAGDFVATRIESIVIIPEQPGPLNIPEVRVPWFDVERGEIRIAAVPAQRFDVQSGAAPSTLAAPRTPPVRIDPPPTPAAAEDAEALTREVGPLDVPLPWRSIAIALVVLWSLTMLAWWRARSRGGDARGPLLPTSAPTTAPTSSALLAQLEAACARSDAQQARNALARWRPGAHLGAGPRAELDALIGDLDAALYAPGGATWNGGALAKFLKRHGKVASAAPARADTPALPPLHPRTVPAQRH